MGMELTKKIKLIILGICLILPILYYGLIATDIYGATAKFSVQGNDSSPVSGVLSLLSGGSSSTGTNAYLAVEYIESEAMLNLVNNKLQLRKHYSDKQWDFVSRLSSDASMEDFLEYWQSIVRVSYDSQASIVTVEALAYTPEMAKELAETVLAFSEDFMNKMNDRLQGDTVLQAKNELKSAEVRYAKARQDLNAFRLSSTELDPQATAEGRVGIALGLESQISALQVEYETKRQIMQKDSLPVRILEKNIIELQDQLVIEKQKMIGVAGPEMLELLEKYETLVVENEFAKNYYITALASLESARVQSESKTVYLEAFQHPLLPDQAVYPKRIQNIFLSIFVVCVGFALILFIIAAVKEHIGV